MPPRDRLYTYDPRTGRYRDRSTGRLVPRTQVRAWLDVALDRASDRIAALARQLRARQIDLVSWQVRMAREVKNVQLYSAAMAKGGWAQLSPADLGRVGQAVQVQLRFLNRFAQQIKTGEQAKDGRLEMRARLYAQAGRALFHRVERLDMEVRGMTEEASVRHASDSCGDCVEAEALGWVPIGTLVPVGSRECKGNCRCEIEYRATTPSQDVRVGESAAQPVGLHEGEPFIGSGRRRGENPVQNPGTYFHVAGPGYEEGEPLRSYRALVERGFEPEWKWEDVDPAYYQDADKVALHDSFAEARDFASEWGGRILQVDIPEDARSMYGLKGGVNEEGYPFVWTEIPADLIKAVR